MITNLRKKISNFSIIMDNILKMPLDCDKDSVAGRLSYLVKLSLLSHKKYFQIQVEP